MNVLVSSILCVSFSSRPVSLGNNTFKEKLLHLHVLCPRLAEKRNILKTGFQEVGKEKGKNRGGGGS